MNQYPYIPSLEPKQVKELCRQIRVLRSDYPRLSDDEIAEEWAEHQRYLASTGRENLYVTWLEDPTWRSGFMRAASFAGRQTEAKQKAKAQRRRWKEIVMDRQPSTAAQRRYVKRLAKSRGVNLSIPPEELSKLAASRMIQKLIDTPSRELPPS